VDGDYQLALMDAPYSLHRACATRKMRGGAAGRGV
jgi:hypothetical protein